MLAMAVPGTVLGVGYIRGYSGGLFHSANWPIFAEGGALHSLFPNGLLWPNHLKVSGVNL